MAIATVSAGAFSDRLDQQQTKIKAIPNYTRQHSIISIFKNHE